MADAAAWLAAINSVPTFDLWPPASQHIAQPEVHGRILRLRQANGLIHMDNKRGKACSRWRRRSYGKEGRMPCEWLASPSDDPKAPEWSGRRGSLDVSQAY